jgi:hypothetical protein
MAHAQSLMRRIAAHIFFFISNLYGHLYIKDRIEIEKQPFDGFQRYFPILPFLFKIRSTYYHGTNT